MFRLRSFVLETSWIVALCLRFDGNFTRLFAILMRIFSQLYTFVPRYDRFVRILKYFCEFTFVFLGWTFSRNVRRVISETRETFTLTRPRHGGVWGNYGRIYNARLQALRNDNQIENGIDSFPTLVLFSRKKVPVSFQGKYGFIEEKCSLILSNRVT